jgi:hypothetical protein
MPPKKDTTQDHPLANILINVLIPVLALSYLSKDPAFEAAPKPWHLGPVKALVIALALPIGYGIWFFIKTRKANFFSGLGLFSVLLTGGLTLYLWNADGTVKPNAHILFAIKEASMPFILAIAVVGSHWSPTPLIRVFLFNDTLFDVRKIDGLVAERNLGEQFRSLMLHATLLFSASFLLSTVLNLGLALYFLGDLDHTAVDAREQYNARVAKLTFWGFGVIGVPVLVFLFFTLRRLMKGLAALTGLKDEELLLPR